MSVDPSGFSAGDMNLYRYVSSNPIIFVDPTGLMSFADRVGTGAASGWASGTASGLAAGGIMGGPAGAVSAGNTGGIMGGIFGAVSGALMSPKASFGEVAAAGLMQGLIAGITAGIGAGLAPPTAGAPSAALRACFVAGTLVQTDDGFRPIETIVDGTHVVAFDFESKTWTRKPVVALLVHDYTGDIVRIVAGEQVLSATANHPFWVIDGKRLADRPRPKDVSDCEQDSRESGRWVEASDLQVGDVLLSYKDGPLQVTDLIIQHDELSVFNIEVADVHNYAVTNLGILVHNKAAQYRPPSLPSNARTADIQEVYRRLAQYHGVDTALASERLHAGKQALGIAAGEDLLFDLTGNVFHPATLEWLFSLTSAI